MNYSKLIIDKLRDKGFNGGEIHLFMAKFGIGGIWIEDPNMWQRQHPEVYKRLRAERIIEEKAKLELACIAADFERPR